jgi:hypothetical protein
MNRQQRRRAERQSRKLHPSSPSSLCWLCGTLIASEEDRDTPARLQSDQGPTPVHWWCASEMLAVMGAECPVCNGTEHDHA